MLKGISVPTYEVSAMTMRNVMRYWLRSPEPMQRILRGNLQDLWIAPLAQRLAQLGCDVRLGHEVQRFQVGDGRIVALQVRTPLALERMSVERVVCAVPAERMAELVTDDVYDADPGLGSLRYLRSRAMAALDIYCTRTVADLPAAHVNLLGSNYGLSFLDVSQLWDNQAGRTVLNCIASDFTALASLGEEHARDLILEELRRFIPELRPEVIERTFFQPHTGQPLFMNNAGNWSCRPEARTKLRNLYLAGDYCRSRIDLVSMEGAVSTGLLAAEAVRRDLDLGKPVEVLVPPEYPGWLLVVARTLLLPFVLIALILAWLGRKRD